MRRRPFPLLAARRRPPRRGGINLVSLMDIFTILVFFLLVHSGEAERLPGLAEVRLPAAQAQQAPPAGPVITVDGVSVRAGERLLVHLAEHTPEALAARLGEALAPLAEGHTTLTVLGDEGLPYRILEAVLEGCARAGFRDVALAVRREAGDG